MLQFTAADMGQKAFVNFSYKFKQVSLWISMHRNFSDRVLGIETMAGLPENKSDGECCNNYRKRRGEDIEKENGTMGEYADCCREELGVESLGLGQFSFKAP
ncbi:hypothetical protein NE237_022723 [Protea cynaroides]|uniref:Uncharacterized protein n=1 Tax=Protea cynaroides TaxID=273540 RepID=A0A9Q0HFV2_9MAGN|nr:hypothetical protein NE237_022723 [Protea cynaroides]